MPISPTRIRSLTTRIVLGFDGTDENLVIWVRPEELTPKVQRELRRATRDMKKAQAVAAEAGEETDDDVDINMMSTYQLLIRLIEHWDLYEGDVQNTLPVTVETLEGLGIRILNRIAEEVLSTLQVDPKKSPTSARGYNVIEGSATAAKPQALPTGTSFSN